MNMLQVHDIAKVELDVYILNTNTDCSAIMFIMFKKYF